jgi:putative transposase
MLTWSHVRFRQRLLDKAKQYPWCKVVVTEEPYTSKTCTNCGWVHLKLRASKEFKCQQCKVVLDRDSNGARNIILRYLTLSKKAPVSSETLALGLGP